MEKFICISDSKEVFNNENESLGMSGERVLCYMKSLNRKRVYRQSYPNSKKDMGMFEYKSKEKAQKLCGSINSAYNDDFYPKGINKQGK